MHCMVYNCDHVCTGTSKKSGQLQQLGRMKLPNEKGETTSEIPTAWAVHFGQEREFNCINVFELLVRKQIKPMYDSTGHRLFSVGAPLVEDAAEELPSQPRDEHIPESTDSESNTSNDSDSESDAS